MEFKKLSKAVFTNKQSYIKLVAPILLTGFMSACGGDSDVNTVPNDTPTPSATPKTPAPSTPSTTPKTPSASPATSKTPLISDAIPNDPNHVANVIPGFDTPPVPVKRPDPQTLKHKALLGPLVGATVTVSPLTMPDTVIATATTANDGTFTVDATEAFGHRLLLVKVTGGQDIDANDDGKPDNTPTTNKSTVMMVIQGDLLGTKAVNVNVLTDVIARRALAYASYLPEEDVQQAIDKMAYQMLKGDINNDKKLGYLDILQFNPALDTHKNSLSFNYKAAVLTAQADGKSLVNKYHNNQNIDKGIAESFNFFKLDMPTPAESNRVSITVKANTGGYVSSDDNKELVAFANGADSYKFTMGQKDQPIKLKATADEGFKFSSWIGCLNVQADKTCLVKPTENQLISASFILPENKTATNVDSVVTLDTTDPKSKIGVVFENDTVIITTKSDSPMVDALKNIKASSVFNTGITKRPQIQITKILSRKNILGNNFYQAKFKFKDINIFDVYDKASFEIPEKSMTLDDLTGVTYSDVVSDSDKKFSVDTPANREYTPGPLPLDDQPSGKFCTAGSEALYGSKLQNGRLVVVCLAKDIEPIKPGQECAQGSVPTPVLDGRNFCTQVVTASRRPDVMSIFPDMSASALLQPKSDLNLKQSFNSGRYVTLDAQPTKKNVTSILSAELQKAKDEGRMSEKKQANEVWLTGYGRAFDMGDGVYLTNNPNKAGLLMIEIEGKPTELSPTQAHEEFNAYCQKQYDKSISVSDTCLQAQRKFSFPSAPFEFEIPTKYKWLTITVKFQVELDLQASGSAKWIKPLRAEVSSSGKVTITPTLGLDVTASGGELFNDRGQKKKTDEEEAEIYKKIIGFDFASKTVAAPVLAAGIEFGAGVDLTGEIKWENSLKLPTSARWNGYVAAGWGCYGVKWVRVAKKSRGFWSWFTSWVRVPVPQCSGAQHFHFNVTPTFYSRLDSKLSINAMVEPYLQLKLYAGPRGIAEELLQLTGRAFIQGQIKGETPTMRLSNIPADLRASGGKKLCFIGDWELKGGIYAGLRSQFIITTEDQPIGKVLNLKKETTLGEIKFPLLEFGWNSGSGFSSKFRSEKPEITSVFKSEDDKQCNGSVPSTKNFRAGRLMLHRGQKVFNNRIILIMQYDGNLVLYTNNNGRPGRALWSSRTSNRGGTVAVFQGDGNLVIYNTHGYYTYAVWASNTWRRGRKLSLQSNKMVIYDASNRAIWASN